MRSVAFLALDWEKIGTKLYGYVLAKRYTSNTLVRLNSETRRSTHLVLNKTFHLKNEWRRRPEGLIRACEDVRIRLTNQYRLQDCQDPLTTD